MKSSDDSRHALWDGYGCKVFGWSHGNIDLRLVEAFVVAWGGYRGGLFRISPSGGSFSVVFILDSLVDALGGCFFLVFRVVVVQVASGEDGVSPMGGSACCVASYGLGGREFAY